MTKLLVTVLALALTVPLPAQDAPSTTVERVNERSGPYPTFWQVVKDPYFLYPSAVQWSAAGFDAGATIYGLRVGKCQESNPDLGPHPSSAKVIGLGLLIDGAITGLRFGMIKAIPYHSHSKARWIARGASVALAAYSADRHTVGGSHWFTYDCFD